jgi:hypothetical protein
MSRSAGAAEIDHQSQRRSDGFSLLEIRNPPKVGSREKRNNSEREETSDRRKSSASLPVRELKNWKKRGRKQTPAYKGESETDCIDTYDYIWSLITHLVYIVCIREQKQKKIE